MGGGATRLSDIMACAPASLGSGLVESSRDREGSEGERIGEERRGEERIRKVYSLHEECISSSGRPNVSPTQHPGNYLRIAPSFHRHD